ncbi:hypothetical protein [Streptomyces sp. NPDC020983]|uniref:hypothetical protein n=1 Tax=Streptomyces sp. NPDC020983 TaxID=3365106 RepID=UPI0037A6678D
MVAAVLGAGLLAAAGCGGSSAPGPGQAVLIGTYDSTTVVGQVLAAGRPLGATSDSAGTTYLLNSPLMVGLSTAGKGTSFAATGSYFDAALTEGLVAMPGGAVLFGHGAEVVRLDTGSGKTSVLAGDAHRTRGDTASAPATATPAGVRFTRNAVPIGVSRSGAVMIVDGRALWSLAGGRLTRVYQQPAPAGGRDDSLIGRGSAVTADGTAYVRAAKNTPATLAAVLVVPPHGTAAPLSLPASIPGVSGRPADLTPTWLAPDGANGLYVHAAQPSPGKGDYVLHVHDGTATLVMSAEPPASDAGTGTCHVRHPVDATRFPCPLPTTLSYHAGRLVLAGERPYAVRLVVSRG